MEDSRHDSPHLWERRQELPRLPVPGAAVASVLLCLLAALGTVCGAAAILTASVCGAILAALLLLHRTPLSAAAILLAGTAVLLAAPDRLSAGLSLLFIPMGISAAAAVYRGMSRMAASVLTAFAAGLCSAVAAAVWLISRAMTAEEGVAAARSALYEALCAWQIPVPGRTLLTVFSPEAAQALVDYLISMAPAAVVCTLFLLGCAVNGLLWLILVLLGAREDFFPGGRSFLAGRGCAVIYCGAQLMLLLAAVTRDAQPLYYAMYNTVIIFMLPLSLTGFGVLIGQLRSMESLGAMSRAAIVCLMVLIAAAGLYWFFTAAALYGIYIVFRRRAGGN